MSQDTSLPEDFDAVNESPYRRRPRAVAVSRAGFFRSARRPLHWILFAVFVVAPLAYGGAWLAAFARTSPQFDLAAESGVAVEGNHFVSRQEIMDALGIEAASGAAANIFRFSLDRKRNELEAIPWVRSAALARAYPRRLEVRIVERAPVAFVNVDGRVKLIDGDGVILEKPERSAFDFPVLDGIGAIADAAERKSRVALYVRFIHDWAAEGPSSGWMLSEVDLSDAEDLKTLLVQGQDTILVHFGHQEFAPRFHTFLALLPEVRKTTPKIDSVDLRFRGQLIVNPETRKPPAPLAGNDIETGAGLAAREAS